MSSLRAYIVELRALRAFFSLNLTLYYHVIKKRQVTDVVNYQVSNYKGQTTENRSDAAKKCNRTFITLKVISKFVYTFFPLRDKTIIPIFEKRLWAVY